MATHKSAIKRARQNIRKHKRNTAHRSLLKSAARKVLAEVSEKNKEKAQEALKQTSRTIAKIAAKGVIHKRAASRKISGLAKKVHQLSRAV